MMQVTPSSTPPPQAAGVEEWFVAVDADAGADPFALLLADLADTADAADTAQGHPAADLTAAARVADAPALATIFQITPEIETEELDDIDQSHAAREADEGGLPVDTFATLGVPAPALDARPASLDVSIAEPRRSGATSAPVEPHVPAGGDDSSNGRLPAPGDRARRRPAAGEGAPFESGVPTEERSASHVPPRPDVLPAVRADTAGEAYDRQLQSQVVEAHVRLPRVPGTGSGTMPAPEARAATAGAGPSIPTASATTSIQEHPAPEQHGANTIVARSLLPPSPAGPAVGASAEPVEPSRVSSPDDRAAHEAQRPEKEIALQALTASLRRSVGPSDATSRHRDPLGLVSAPPAHGARVDAPTPAPTLVRVALPILQTVRNEVSGDPAPPAVAQALPPASSMEVVPAPHVTREAGLRYQRLLEMESDREREVTAPFPRGSEALGGDEATAHGTARHVRQPEASEAPADADTRQEVPVSPPADASLRPSASGHEPMRFRSAPGIAVHTVMLERAPDAALSFAAPHTGGREPVEQQIVQAVRLQWRDGIGDARLTLQPEYLGSVTISLRLAQGGVTAVIHADEPQVRAWLQANEVSLRQGLSDQGLTLERFVVEDEPPTPGREDTGRQRREEAPPRRPHVRGEHEPTFEMIM